MATYSGTIDLRVTGNAEQKAELIKKRINEIKSIANSLKPVPNLFDKRGNDAIVKAKEELKKLVEQYGKGTGTGNRFSNTIAGLNQQLNGFNRVLGNVNIKSDEFVQALTASEKVSRRLARAEAERLKVQTQINTANTVGRATSVQETLDLGKIIPQSVAGLELYQRELQETLRNVRIGSQDYQDLARAIADVNRQLAVAQGQGAIQGPALPPGFSEKGRIPKPGRRGSRFQNIATGAGFPLLFGGGPLQAVAGGIGGAFGGLGGSIAASAIASQVEAFAQAATEAGQALNSTGGALDFVREKALFSSAENEELAAKLEEQGDAAGLAKLLTEELVDVIGNTGVEALDKLGTKTQETTRLWNELTLQLQALIAGPLTNFLKVVNQFLGEQGNRARLAALQKDLAGTEAGGQLAAEIERLRPTSQILQQGETRTLKGVLDPKNVTALLEKFTQVRPPSTRIPVTGQDRRRFAVSGGRAKRARESQLPQLQAEVALQERLGVLSRQVAKAKAEENSIREAALNMEIELEKQASRIEKINLEKIPTAEKLEKIKLVELATDEKIFSIQDSLNQARAKQAEKGQEVISSLENEKALLDARLKGTEDEVALTQLIAEKTKGLNETDAERVTLLLQGVDALKKQVAQADKMEAIYQQIGQSIASGVVDTLSAAVDQTKSLADAAANTLRNIANILLQLGVNTALQGLFPGSSLFSGLQGFAGGGRPPVNKPSIVGERGPELFVPSTSGTIVPNGQFGGGGTNVVVNVDAKGSSASGDTAAGKQLGGLIGAAVQAELIKQKRPGGLLAG